MDNDRPASPVGDGAAHGTATHQGKKGKANYNVPQGSHRRTISGSLLASLPFLRSAKLETAPSSPSEVANEGDTASGGVKRASSIAGALRQSQGRKRKGSLRKSVITGKMFRERRNSFLSPRTPMNPLATVTTHSQMGLESPDDETTPRRFSYEDSSQNSSSESGWAPSERLSVSTDNSFSQDSPDHLTPRLLASPLTSPTGPYASTTDDDEGISFFRPTASSSSAAYTTSQLQTNSASLQRRRSNRSGQHSSLTIVHTPADIAMDDEWDYSETEWWGWVVLIATWIVFVVGMGSCLEVWSWAWDVGETPYAPPELEDDPTLPITGYYPALMVCTAVMAWVWVVVAWVGMKYFRHAKVVGDDG